MRSDCMQITGFSAVEREMSYILLSSAEAAIRIKPRKGSPTVVGHWILTVPQCLLGPNKTYDRVT